MRIKTLALGLGAVMFLAGCNDSGGGMGPVAAAPPPPVAMNLPAGAPCSNEINAYESVVKGDLDTGNVEEKVYAQIQKEMARAASACSAGHGAEAHSLVLASKSRHGYRA